MSETLSIEKSSFCFCSNRLGASIKLVGGVPSLAPQGEINAQRYRYRFDLHVVDFGGSDTTKQCFGVRVHGCNDYR